jgi:hypothetical protein
MVIFDKNNFPGLAIFLLGCFCRLKTQFYRYSNNKADSTLQQGA